MFQLSSLTISLARIPVPLWRLCGNSWILFGIVLRVHCILWATWMMLMDPGWILGGMTHYLCQRLCRYIFIDMFAKI